MSREKAKLQAKREGGGTAEEWTNERREARRQFKLERARAAREKIERQRLVEEGKLDPADLDAPEKEPVKEPLTNGASVGRVPDADVVQGSEAPSIDAPATTPAIIFEDDGDEPDLEDQEHLQLTLEEAFFLTYGLGVLDVRSPDTVLSDTQSTTLLLKLFTSHSFFPPKPISRPLAPDDPFLLNYVTYHHFRSLGWVVRPGIKFAVDYLLYQRGPVFSHAEFALIIMPAYSDPYWSSEEGVTQRRVKETKDWWWFHCVNRVQGAVLKTLVLVYVDVPKPDEGGFNGDIGGLLKRYKVREFAIKRWVMNRLRE